MTRTEEERLINLLRPFVDAKIYNPNRSDSPDTKRTLNVHLTAIKNLTHFYHELTEDEECEKRAIKEVLNVPYDINPLAEQLAGLPRYHYLQFQSNQTVHLT